MPKHVLVTGGAGFIGHHLIDHILQETDWTVCSLDRLDFSGNLNRLNEVVETYDYDEQKRVTVVFHDLKAPLNPQVQKLIGTPDIILHLAAASHVDRSIEFPLEFLYDNTAGTVNILEYARALPNLDRFLYFSTDEVFGPAPEGRFFKEYDRYNSSNPYSASKAAGEEFCVAYQNTYKMPIIITHCHDQKTNAFTPNGIMPVQNLKVGDHVWTLNENHEVEAQPILEIVQEHHSGKMVQLKANKLDQLVTDNHRVLCSMRKTKQNSDFVWTYVEAKTLLNTSHRIAIPTSGKWEAAEDTKIVPERNRVHHNANTLLSSYDPKTIASFIGWYVSEGSSNGNGTISIAQSKPKNVSIICDLFHKVGLIPAIYGRNIQASSTEFYKTFLEDCGRFAKNKKIPDWIMNSHIDVLQCLWNSLMAGDGSQTGTQDVYYTKSYALAQQMCELGIKLNKAVRICERYTWNPAKTKKAKSYIVRFGKSVIHVEKKNIKHVNYSGKIWCVRTKNSNFFVERNGVIGVSGNTMNVFGERQLAEKFIPMCIRKIRDNEVITIHSNKERTKAGSRFYIHAKDVARGILFLLKVPYAMQQNIVHNASGYDTAMKIPKFNLVGERELDNFTLAGYVAGAQGKKSFAYEMVDFHSARPGHDLRYALDGGLMASLGWKPEISVEDRLKEMVAWTLANDRWL